jgi:hypothetical protein
MSDLCCAPPLKKWRLAVLLRAWDGPAGDQFGDVVDDLLDDVLDDHHMMKRNGADQGPAQDRVSLEGDPPCLEEIREFFNRQSSR